MPWGSICDIAPYNYNRQCHLSLQGQSIKGYGWCPAPLDIQYAIAEKTWFFIQFFLYSGQKKLHNKIFESVFATMYFLTGLTWKSNLGVEQVVRPKSIAHSAWEYEAWTLHSVPLFFSVFFCFTLQNAFSGTWHVQYCRKFSDCVQNASRAVAALARLSLEHRGAEYTNLHIARRCKVLKKA